ncbi:ACT domain-containing protein [Aquirufa sp. A-Brett2-15D]
MGNIKKLVLFLAVLNFSAFAQKRNLTLSLLPDSYAVCRLAPDAKVPDWAFKGSFYSISKTSDELSIVVDQRYAPAGIKKAENWKGFKVEGPLDFALTGILAALSKTLADNQILLFSISTFDTDYILVESQYYEKAKKVLAIENTVN